MDLDEDAAVAGTDVILRAGATGFEFAYLHDDVPPEEAGWYATATYRGAKIIEEDHRGPVEAIEALARRILTGAMCTHCGGLIALSDRGAMISPGATMLDGSVMTEERARSMTQCRWTRQGRRWVRGCADRIPEGVRQPGFSQGPNASMAGGRSSKPGKRRAAKKGRRR